jgi:hypothetical protein
MFFVQHHQTMKELSMSGYNSHDCHMMMMVFLTITIRAIKPMRIKVLIAHLCYFFNTISQKVIGRKELDDLKAYMIETMCMLEMCFPPFLYARTPNDTSRELDPHIGLAILTQYVSVRAVLSSFEGLCAESCSPGALYYGRLHNRRSGQMLRGLCKK